MVFKKKGYDDDEDFEIEDPENYRNEPENKYSHELLIMEQLRRILKVLSQEMRKGYEEKKADRSGNVISYKYCPDTRREAGEAVESLKNLMIGDISKDKITKVSIPKLFDDLKALEQKYVKMEEDAWKLIPPHYKKPNSGWVGRWDHIPGTLNYDYIYGEKYLQESVKIYRLIYEEIQFLIHRMGYLTAIRM